MINKSELPKNWKLATIDEFISSDGVFVDGDWIESKDQDPNGDVRLIQLADIGDGNFRNKSSRFLTLKRAKELNCTFLEEGDVIVARMPDPIGRACIFPLKGNEKFVTAVDVAIIRTGKNGAFNKFLVNAINCPQIRNEIESLQSGTTRKRISRKNLSTILFPLPPLAEQKRIVAKIEELFSELDAGLESLKTAQAQLKTYRQAVLKYAFEGKLTNDNVNEGELPNGWKWVKFEEIGNAIDPQPSHRTPPKVENGIPYVSTKDFDFELDKIDFSDARIVSSDVLTEHLERYQLEIGDFVIGKIGTIGRPVRIVLPQNYTLSANIVLIQPRKANSTFLYYLFQSNVIEKEFTVGKKATTQAAFGIQKVRLLDIPLPELEEQQRIVEEIESRLSVCDKLEETIIASLKQAEALRQSILKQAFEGKLI